MCSVALQLAVGILAKEKLHADWLWGIYQNLKRSMQNRRLPCPQPSGREDSSSPQSLRCVISQSVRTERGSSVPPHPFKNMSLVATAFQGDEVTCPQSQGLLSNDHAVTRNCKHQFNLENKRQFLPVSFIQSLRPKDKPL